MGYFTMSYPIRFSNIVLPVVLMIVVLLNEHLSAQSIPTDNDSSANSNDLGFVNKPVLDVLSGEIENGLVYQTFLLKGQELIKSPKNLDVVTVEKELKRKRRGASIEIPSPEISSTNSVYERMVKSSLLVGVVYDCGRCSNLHANIAGGVLISKDGLVLTNYHVASRNDEGVKGLVVMSHDGRCWPISEVLSASARDDVALIRIDCDDSLEPCVIADAEPSPLTSVRVLSNPRNEYFVLTEGVVSRHVQYPPNKGRARWMEITAEFAAGSSGSGVFNDKGQLVGLVSRVQPIIRGPKSDEATSSQKGDSDSSDQVAYAEMILRQCVTLSAIRDRFSPEQ